MAEDIIIYINSDISIYNEDPFNRGSYRFVFEITDVKDPLGELPEELLLFRKTFDSVTGCQVDKFVSVAIMSDLNYPVGEPDCHSASQLFRKSSVDGYLPSLDECYRVRDKMKELLRINIGNLKKIRDNMVELPEEVLVI